MPKLQNPKHERFAVQVAKGIPATKAYLAAYPGAKTQPEASASRLSRNAKVAIRIAEIQKKAETESVLTLQEMLEYLTSVARTPIGEIDEKSPLAQSAEYDISTTAKGKTQRRTLKIKMPDKLRAIELAAKLKGLLKENVEMRHSGFVQHDHKAIILNIPAAIAQPRLLRQIEARKDPEPETP